MATSAASSGRSRKNIRPRITALTQRLSWAEFSAIFLSVVT
jgi:hypothetical protein